MKRRIPRRQVTALRETATVIFRVEKTLLRDFDHYLPSHQRPMKLRELMEEFVQQKRREYGGHA